MKSFLLINNVLLCILFVNCQENNFNYIANVSPYNSSQKYLIATYNSFDKMHCLSLCTKDLSCKSCTYKNKKGINNCNLYKDYITAFFTNNDPVDMFVKYSM